ncbi:uncharacterized protein LOC109791037 isoform X3 [Cajanus cajan]|uniref:uncharacterized protein LOC109791037 isoform X3 n=1 Tax=Cajanus cajan TaxID=3821 RepID=UPI00098D8030|nr:uncharacterized protein LOC109791037 isoform X3 [Cajanus cajan]
MSGGYQNRSDWNNISFGGCSQSQFNYHHQVPHRGWDYCYGGGTYVPHQTSGPTIHAAAPLHQPQPMAYCKICDVKLSSYKVVEQHNNGKRHQSNLNLREELQGQRISNGLIPNSQMNLVDQPYVSSEATIVKHKNHLQKDVGVTSEVTVEGCKENPRDNTGTQGHSFKHKIGGAKTRKYIKTNDGLRRPVESSKFDVNVETPLQVSALPPRPRLIKTNGQPHGLADSNIINPPKDVRSDSAATATRSPEVTYCKICAVYIVNSMKMHNNGKRHQRMLKWHEKLQMSNISKGQIPKTQKNVVVQSGKKECSLNYMSFETTIATRNNSSVHDHNFKHKIGGNKGKYMKTNDGVRRPMGSSKQNINSLSESVESPVQNSIPTLASLPGPATSQILAPTLIVRSCFEPQFQHVSASQTHLSEGKEQHEIQNITTEITDQPHAPFKTQVLESKGHHEIQNLAMEKNDQAESISLKLHVLVGSDINTRTNANSDAKAIAIGPAQGLMESHVEVSPAVGSNFESQIQHVLHIETELKLSKDTADCESQNCTDEKNNQLLPSVIVEFNSPSGSSTNTQTEDGCSKVEQEMTILTNQSGITKLSQVAVCLKCGDVGFPETRVFCNKCQVYALHRYCLDGPVIFTDDVTWFCEDCEPMIVDTSFHDQCTLLSSEKNISLNSAKEASQARIEPQSCIERVENNKQKPQNIAAETKVLLSENNSLSPHGLSQCRNNSEMEKKFEKECQPVPRDQANTREGSMIVTVQPVADPVWRGSLCLLYPSFETVIGLLCHVSTTACSKVLEETKLFPDVFCPDLLQRSAVWPKSFMEHGPNEESIALYFFPHNESVERAFHSLVDDMISSDLAIRAEVENAELLVFPSTLLPIQYRRFQKMYYLWGLFRAKKTSRNTNNAVCGEATSASSSTVTQ